MNWCIAKRMSKDALKVTTYIVAGFYAFAAIGFVAGRIFPQPPPLPTGAFDYFAIGLLCMVVAFLGLFFVVAVVAGGIGATLEWYKGAKEACRPPKPKKKRNRKK